MPISAASISLIEAALRMRDLITLEGAREVRCWHIPSLRCDATIGRLSGDKADSSNQSDRRIYGFTA